VVEGAVVEEAAVEEGVPQQAGAQDEPVVADADAGTGQTDAQPVSEDKND